MSLTSNESDNRMVQKDQIKSPSIDEGSCGGPFLGGDGLKKGPWTSAEDAILVEYVNKHGEGNWNSVQKHSGLSRCGKSCRLRWANHLRPDLRKGAFTADEERKIIELHATMGNKWARMAAHMPGRTDNEIKNYWNTRIKRCQRAGLPLHPPNVCSQSFNENQQNQSGSETSAGDKHNSTLLQPNSYDIPAVRFDHIKANIGTLSMVPPFPIISASSMLNQGSASGKYGSITPANCSKRLRESETLFPGFHDCSTCGMPTFEQFSNNSSEKIDCPFGLGFPYDPDPRSKNLTPLTGAIPGSHALLNGNLSTSQPFNGTAKLELPSLQYPETVPSSCLTCSPTLLEAVENYDESLNSWLTFYPTPFEAVDAHFESPPTTVSVQSDCVPPQNSGLLEAVIHEAQTMGTEKNQQSEKSSNSSTVISSDLIERSTPNLCSVDGGEYGDPISPLRCSAASVFGVCTYPTSGSSFDGSSPGITVAGLKFKSEIAGCVSAQDVEGTEISPRLEFSWPDALLRSSWSSDSSKEDEIIDITPFLNEDLWNSPDEYAEPCPWNDMPHVC